MKKQPDSLDVQIAATRRLAKSICRSRKRALKFLVDAGIATPDGQLAEPYRDSETNQGA